MRLGMKSILEHDIIFARTENRCSSFAAYSHVSWITAGQHQIPRRHVRMPSFSVRAYRRAFGAAVTGAYCAGSNRSQQRLPETLLVVVCQMYFTDMTLFFRHGTKCKASRWDTLVSWVSNSARLHMSEFFQHHCDANCRHDRLHRC